MSELTIFTRGKAIKVNRARIQTHKGLELAVLDLAIGDMDICIHFETHLELITFCEYHNFEYLDERG